MKPYSVFLNYRREDTAPYAIALKNEIEERLASTRVFLDTVRLRPSIPWPETLRDEVRNSDLVLVLIGKRWMRPGDGGLARIAVEGDWVREELKLALAEKQGDRIIPVFFDDAVMPARADLPPDVAALADLQGTRIRAEHWPDMIESFLDLCRERLNTRFRAEEPNYPQPNLIKKGIEPASELRLRAVLADSSFNGWSVDTIVSGEAVESWLVRKFRFKTFGRALKFMQQVGAFCEQVDHHPHWTNLYRDVDVRLSTWDAGRQITERDIEVAQKMNGIARGIAAGRPAP